jgi:formamidopyrimidine-DNA glycosylase
MPELPEIESLRRILARSVVGRTIVSARVTDRRLRQPVTTRFASRVSSHSIAGVSRRAKYLIIELDDGKSEDPTAIIMHFGMSGSLTRRDGKFDGSGLDENHDHVELDLDDDTKLVYNDPRRFGLVLLTHLSEVDSTPELKDLGPEPLSEDFNADYLAKVARGRKTAIKNLIMDQGVVAGIGNIYASEVLFRAGVQPNRRASLVSREEIERIVAETKPLLLESIKRHGTTFRNYRDISGRPGRYGKLLMVYGREGEKCLKCGNKIRAITVGQRSTFYCAHCQK